MILVYIVEITKKGSEAVYVFHNQQEMERFANSKIIEHGRKGVSWWEM